MFGFVFVFVFVFVFGFGFGLGLGLGLDLGLGLGFGYPKKSTCGKTMETRPHSSPALAGRSQRGTRTQA